MIGVVEVVRRTAEYLTSRDVRADEVLLKEDGSPLTVGDVHAQIRLWVAELGAELPEGFIFSVGRDAGVPHSIGNPEDLMRLGQTIIYDIYPAERGGGQGLQPGPGQRKDRIWRYKGTIPSQGRLFIPVIYSSSRRFSAMTGQVRSIYLFTHSILSFSPGSSPSSSRLL